VWEKDIDRVRATRVLNQDAELLFVPADHAGASHGHEPAHAV